MTSEFDGVHLGNYMETTYEVNVWISEKRIGKVA